MSAIAKAERNTVRDYLSRPFVWKVPVYQRHYSWDRTTDLSGPIELFWGTVQEQSEQRLAGKNPDAHYLGAILVSNQTDPKSAKVTKIFDVVDGQQRLTTIAITMLAIIEVAERHCGKEQLQNNLAKYFFIDEEGRREQKLNPTNFDKHQFRQILSDVYDLSLRLKLGGVSKENALKPKVDNVFNYFQNQIGTLIAQHSDKNATVVLQALTESVLDGFHIVLIVLEKTDAPQKVFESMNNTAKPLTTFDLIRNRIFLRSSEEQGNDVELFNSPLWQSLENAFWEQSSGKRNDKMVHIDSYIARMLIAKLKREVKFDRNSLFKTFLEFSAKHESVEQVIESMTDYTKIYKYLVAADYAQNPIHSDFSFGIFHHDNWENKDFYPLIFMVIKSTIEEHEKQRILELLESYIVRREVCAFTRGNYNKDVPVLCGGLSSGVSYDSLWAVLAKREAPTVVFPNDEYVKNACRIVDFYKSPIKHYVLSEINRQLDPSNERVSQDNLTVDHILPQKWFANSVWRKFLLGDSENSQLSVADTEHRKGIIENYINTIGNLTLLTSKRNIQKSNDDFAKVKGMLANSNLLMNREIAKMEKWDEKDILKRSVGMAEVICQRWKYPSNDKNSR